MSALVEAVGLLVLLVLVGVVVLTVISARGGNDGGTGGPIATVSDRHKHRWTRWRIIDERKIHLYGEVDEGRDLPDRIDVVMRRECARCGLPQTKTVRGLDPELRA